MHMSRDDLDARTNAYTLIDAGRHALQRQAEALADPSDLPQLVATEKGSTTVTTTTAPSNSGRNRGHSRPMLSESRYHWADDYRLVPYGNNRETRR